MLQEMGLEAFAGRARRELQATGETARKRTVAARIELTAQEAGAGGKPSSSSAQRHTGRVRCQRHDRRCGSRPVPDRQQANRKRGSDMTAMISDPSPGARGKGTQRMYSAGERTGVGAYPGTVGKCGKVRGLVYDASTLCLVFSGARRPRVFRADRTCHEAGWPAGACSAASAGAPARNVGRPRSCPATPNIAPDPGRLGELQPGSGPQNGLADGWAQAGGLPLLVLRAVFPGAFPLSRARLCARSPMCDHMGLSARVHDVWSPDGPRGGGATLASVLASPCWAAFRRACVWRWIRAAGISLAHADTTIIVVRPILTLSPFFSRWDW